MSAMMDEQPRFLKIYVAYLNSFFTPGCDTGMELEKSGFGTC